MISSQNPKYHPGLRPHHRAEWTVTAEQVVLAEALAEHTADVTDVLLLEKLAWIVVHEFPGGAAAILELDAVVVREVGDGSCLAWVVTEVDLLMEASKTERPIPPVGR